MPFDDDGFRRLIPRLAQHSRIRAEIVDRYGDETDALLDVLRAGSGLEPEVDEELRELALNAFHSEARTIVALGWDGTAPGGSGGVWVSECEGIHIVTSSDYAAEGPFESLEAATMCECFFTATLEPQVDSEVLPEKELLEIARGVVDWENGGSVWVNGVEYVAEGENLRRQGDDADAS